MLSFLLTLKRLVTGLWRALKLKNFQALLVLVVITPGDDRLHRLFLDQTNGQGK
jgi:hypothetical protein